MDLLVIKFWVFLLVTGIFQFETNSPITVFLACPPSQLSEGLYCTSLLLPPSVATLLRDSHHFSFKTHQENQNHHVKVEYVVLKRIGAKNKVIFRLMRKSNQSILKETDQSWVFIGRTDAKAETPILWPPHARSWLIGKESDAGRDWGQEEKGMTEDEMAGWHHRLDGHEFEWTPGVGDGQGGLVCCDSWGHKESDTTERLNWTEWGIWLCFSKWRKKHKEKNLSNFLI